ncbi:MAG: sulfatase-like hydrolase/transferase [Pseudomonadota bacterium]
MTSRLTALYLLLVPMLIPPLAQTQPPNILLLMAEDMSQRLGAYGDNVARTPNLDNLAQSSVRFTNVFTTAGVCAPSRAALLTGQHQISFAAQHMRTSTGPLGPYLALPPAALRAFPELLRQQGYYTFTDRKLDYQFSGVSAGSGPFTIWDRDNATDTGWRLRKNPEQPFFGLINFLETHESGVMRSGGPPHSKIHQAMRNMRQQANLIAATVTPPADVKVPPYYPDIPAVRADLARHYDNIHQMDKRVGQILMALAADGLMDNTVVIWTTDHGDGLPRAKRELLHSGVHVPLLLSIPTGYTSKSRSVDSRLVSFVDLAPTILELAQAPLPDYLHGTSLLHSQRAYVYASRDRIDEVTDRQRMVFDGRYKYIRSWHPDVAGGHPLAFRDNLDMVRAMRTLHEQGELNEAASRWFLPPGKEQLYDLHNDPYELNNLAESSNPSDARHRARLAKQLDQFLQQTGDSGAIPESLMRRSLLEAGEIPMTDPPTITQHQGQLIMSHPDGVSIGYRNAGDDTWQLYTDPIDRPLSGVRVEARAVRYGWQASDIVEWVQP